MLLTFTLNGRDTAVDVESHELLLDVLRDRLHLTSPKASCGVQVCGSCTVLVDDVPVSSCCYLAADADGCTVTTVEGLADDPLAQRLVDALVRHAGVQCGFCSPAMVLTLRTLLSEDARPDRAQLSAGLRGNLCRCTGYRAIVDAALEVAAEGAP